MRLGAESLSSGVSCRGDVCRTLRAPVLSCALLALGAAVAGVLLHAVYPVSDDAAFEYIGRALDRGEHFYRDVWDNKLPGVYLVDALWQGLFGESYLWHRAAEGAVALATAGLLAAVMRQAGLGGWAYALPALTVLLTLRGSFLNATEAYALPLILGAIFAVMASRGVAGGVLLGLACWFWVPSLLMLVPLSAVSRDSARVPLWVAVGGTLSALACTFVAAIGAGNAAMLLHSWVLYVATPLHVEHHRFGSLGHLPPIVFEFYDGAMFSGVAALSAVLAAVIDAPRTSAQRFGLLWTASMLAAACAGPRFYPHYFIPAGAALLFTIGSYGLVRERRMRTGAFLLLGAAFAGIAVRDAVDEATYRRERAKHVLTVGSLIRSKLDAPTLSVDRYEPGLYLAIGPILRNPAEMVVKAPTFGVESAAPEHAADVTVLTDPRSTAAGTPVCAAATAPWRVYIAPAFAARFRPCP
jgi:hypothetical protein